MKSIHHWCGSFCTFFLLLQSSFLCLYVCNFCTLKCDVFWWSFCQEEDEASLKRVELMKSCPSWCSCLLWLREDEQTVEIVRRTTDINNNWLSISNSCGTAFSVDIIWLKEDVVVLVVLFLVVVSALETRHGRHQEVILWLKGMSMNVRMNECRKEAIMFYIMSRFVFFF